MIQDILAALTKKVENTLFNYCKGLLGKVPRFRDEYDPQTMISTLEHEEKILVFNSSRDLPQNWNDIDFQGLFGEHQDVGSEGPTSEAASVDNEMNIHIEDDPSQVFPPILKPHWMKNSSTAMLLLLESLSSQLSCSWGFLQCVGKVAWMELLNPAQGSGVRCSYLWSSRGVHIPVAFGWLPDKCTVSYYVFLWLVLNTFIENASAISKL